MLDQRIIIWHANSFYKPTNLITTHITTIFYLSVYIANPTPFLFPAEAQSIKRMVQHHYPQVSEKDWWPFSVVVSNYTSDGHKGEASLVSVMWCVNHPWVQNCPLPAEAGARLWSGRANPKAYLAGIRFYRWLNGRVSEDRRLWNGVIVLEGSWECWLKNLGGIYGGGCSWECVNEKRLWRKQEGNTCQGSTEIHLFICIEFCIIYSGDVVAAWGHLAFLSFEYDSMIQNFESLTSALSEVRSPLVILGLWK